METNDASELHVGVVHRQECTQPSLPQIIGKQHARHDAQCRLCSTQANFYSGQVHLGQVRLRPNFCFF